MYFIIEGKTPHTHNGLPVIIKGEQLYYTSYILNRQASSNMPDAAKRFKSKEDAQKYIDRWLQGRGTNYTPKAMEDWK